MDPEPTLRSSIGYTIFKYRQEMSQIKKRIGRYYKFKQMINDKLFFMERARQRKMLRKEKKLKRQLKRQMKRKREDENEGENLEDINTNQKTKLKKLKRKRKSSKDNHDSKRRKLNGSEE